MTPQPARYPVEVVETERRREPAVKVEMVKFIVGMLLAGAASYFATTYGLQERIKVLEVRLDYAQTSAMEARSEVRALTAEVRELRDDVRALSVLTRSRRP